jgi:hypothetical protein
LTYTLDPERWYENQRRLLPARLERGELDEREFVDALEELERRLEEMLAKLDRPFELPK